MFQKQGLHGGEIYATNAIRVSNECSVGFSEGVKMALADEASPTLSQNIDSHIAHLRDRIETLERHKQRLAAGNVLSFTIEELHDILFGV